MSIAFLFTNGDIKVLFINSGAAPNIINSLSTINIFDDVYLGFVTCIHDDAKEMFVKLN